MNLKEAIELKLSVVLRQVKLIRNYLPAKDMVVFDDAIETIDFFLYKQPMNAVTANRIMAEADLIALHVRKYI